MNDLISFISTFKSFDKFYTPIQRSAMFTWSGIRTIVPDNEPDIQDQIKDFPHVQAINGVETAKKFKYGSSSPVIRSLLLRGLDYITTPIIGLINGDILIGTNFVDEIKHVVEKYGADIYVVISRGNMVLQKELNNREEWDKLFKSQYPIQNPSCSSDLFISSVSNMRKMAEDMPEFILGRYGWDNWIHVYVKDHFKYFNGTKFFKILHCKHGYDHIMKSEGFPERRAPSSKHNLSLLRTQIRIDTWPQIEP